MWVVSQFQAFVGGASRRSRSDNPHAQTFRVRNSGLLKADLGSGPREGTSREALQSSLEPGIWVILKLWAPLDDGLYCGHQYLGVPKWDLNFGNYPKPYITPIRPLKVPPLDPAFEDQRGHHLGCRSGVGPRRPCSFAQDTSGGPPHPNSGIVGI